MKRSMKGLFVILAIVMSLVAVQSVCAETVIGTIDSISTEQPRNMIVVDGTEVYGMRISYLANQYGIVLQELMEQDTTVIIDAYEVICLDGSTKLMACRLTVLYEDNNTDTVDLRDCQ
jgi:hypothetical protein